MFTKVTLKSAPELARIIRAADPSYRRHTACFDVKESVALSGTYWDGGSRSTYTAVDLRTMRAVAAPQFNPPQFNGPRETPRVTLPDGIAMVRTGTNCGKVGTAWVTVNPRTVSPLLGQS